MSQGACPAYRDHFNTLERQVADQLPSPKRFARPSLVSLGAVVSYVESETTHAWSSKVMWRELNLTSSVFTVCNFLFLTSSYLTVPAGFHNHRPEQRWHHQQGWSQGRAGHHGPTECEEWGAGGYGEGGQRPHQLHSLPDHVRREAEGCVDLTELLSSQLVSFWIIT